MMKKFAANVALAACGLGMTIGGVAQSTPHAAQNSSASPGTKGAAQNDTLGTRGPSTGPGTDPHQQSGQGSVTPADKLFVRKAIMGNRGEIDAANLALKNASNDDVKKFAQKMVDDHTSMLNDMTAVAQQLNVNVPQTTTAKDKATAARLQQLSGDQFDKAYVRAMVIDHKQDVTDFKKESQTGHSPVKDAAAKSLPVIQGHLDMVEGIQKNIAPKTTAAKTQ